MRPRRWGNPSSGECGECTRCYEVAHFGLESSSSLGSSLGDSVAEGEAEDGREVDEEGVQWHSDAKLSVQTKRPWSRGQRNFSISS